MEKQLLGSEASLQKNFPLNVEHDGKTGTPEEQLLGSHAPTSRTPVPLQHFNKGERAGTFQLSGSEAPLDHTPTKGYTSFKTPMSDRAVKQSK